MRTRIFPASTDDRDAGYTLLELLVVISIVALIAAAAPTAIAALRPALETRQFAYDLAGDLRALRTDAMKQGRTLAANLEIENSRIMIENRQRRIPAGIEVTTLPSDSWAGGQKEMLEFYPSGRSRGGTLEIKRDGLTIEIAVSGVTGAISVSERR